MKKKSPQQVGIKNTINIPTKNDNEIQCQKEIVLAYFRLIESASRLAEKLLTPIAIEQVNFKAINGGNITMESVSAANSGEYRHG